MRLVVTGRYGQLAQSLADMAGPDLVVIALGRDRLDITDRTAIDRIIAEYAPDVVVSAAAYTAVDRAEDDETAAFSANCNGAYNVAAAAEAANLPVIHLSTDYVFSGDKPAAYTETDHAEPRTVYGRSKLAGEQAVLRANERSVILRTAWVHSPYGVNFLKTMLRLACDKETIRVVSDQYGTPTYALDIASGIVTVARRAVANREADDWRGIFHLVASGETTWAGFAEEIFRVSGKFGGPTARVEPITSADYPTVARRPMNSRLDTTKFSHIFGEALPTWQDGVARCLAAGKLG